MTTEKIPGRTRVYQSHHIDSSLWDDFPVRDGDIVISTPAKTGTTWMQRESARLPKPGAAGHAQ
jgi:aryl sulfotransferase